ncbi:hypothetical protein LINBF2_02600 [Limnohabitans sp. INBF002]|nr:hypothetical protein LINBF2_02600 [Limnohabitans sp. INBF002]
MQSILIFLSIGSAPVFDFLVLFSGAAGYDVYSQIGGLRGIGFGVVHVYGAYTIVSACALYIMYEHVNFFKKIFLIASLLLSFFVARTALIVAAVLLIFKSTFRFLVVIFLYYCASYAFYLYGNTDSILYQILEPGVNYFGSGEIYTASTNANLEMIKFPTDLFGWLAGYGKFFDEGLFFENTDLGYSRLTLYGGIGFLNLYLIANIYPVVKGWLLVNKINNSSKDDYKILLFVYAISFLVVNAKGIIDIGLFSYVAMLLAQKSLVSVRQYE